MTNASGSYTRQTVPKATRRASTKAAKADKVANPSFYRNGEVPNHTQDVGWGGLCLNTFMIATLLKRALANVSEQDGVPITPSPAESDKTQVPTLQPGRYRSLSPQLKERFALFGAWPEATHADWLSLAEMEELWAPMSSTAIARKQTLSIIAEN